MKIIAVGLNKTGTKSLNMAMAELGYNSLHVNPFDFHDAINKAIKEKKKILHYLEPYNFLSDIWLHNGLTIDKYNFPLYYSFDYKYKIVKNILKDYPDTLFINNIRNFHKWVKSRKKHIENSQGHWNIFDKDGIKFEYFEQQKLIEAMKKGGLKILDFDIEKHNYKHLCKFLGKEVITKDFPWKKKQRDKYKKAYIVE